MSPALGPEDRFWARVTIPSDVMSGCWGWTGSKTDRGYGMFHVGPNTKARAHRFAYEMVRRRIPEGLVLDHLCRNRACVNPAHLEPVAQAENVRRGLLVNNKHGAKITHEQASEIRRLFVAGGVRQKDLAARLGIAACTVSNIIAGRGWQ